MFRIINPVVYQIDRVINAFTRFIIAIFQYNDGYFHKLITTITSSPLLLISLSLTLCGFVIGVLKRMINV